MAKKIKPEGELFSYLETALWSNSSDDLSPSDFTKEALIQAKQDLDMFMEAASELFHEDDRSHHGHDFWLTRTHQGAGFWDGGYKNGDALTKLAHRFGHLNVEVYRKKASFYGWTPTIL